MDETRKLDLGGKEDDKIPVAPMRPRPVLFDTAFIASLLDAIDDLNDEGASWDEICRILAKRYPAIFMEIYNEVADIDSSKIIGPYEEV